MGRVRSVPPVGTGSTLLHEGPHMIPGIYSAASGMDVAQLQYELVSENLAHMAVPGYRRHAVSFEPLVKLADERESVPPQGLGAQEATEQVDFTVGPLQQTGRPLDVALAGEGFFVIEGPDGPLYTRNGTFHLSGDGRLVTSDGLAVQGESGEITVPNTVSMNQILIATDGTISAGGETIGKLRTVKFGDPSRLERAGTTLFAAPPGMAAEPLEGVVQQGAREMANVSPIGELALLIAATRHYESSQRALRALDETLQLRTSPRNNP